MRNSLVLFLVTLLSSGCTAHGSLYEELGGREGIERISGHFIANVGEDPDVRPYFLHTNLDRFYEQFTDHLCMLTGGPCAYEGDDMVQVHQGMQVTEGDFNRTVELLIDAMDQENVSHPVQNRLLKRLAPLRESIIYK